MSAPSCSWMRTALLGAEVVRAAVVGRSERGPGVVDLGLEREDLEAAAVGEHVTRPGHEAVQAAERLDDVGAGPEHQVVRVAEHHLDAERLEVRRRQRPHRASGADRHEARHREAAAWRGHARRCGPRRRRASTSTVSFTRPAPTGGRAAWRRRSRGSGSPRAGPCRRAVATAGPTKASTSASSDDRGTWKLVRSRSTSRNSKSPWMNSSVRPERTAAGRRLERPHDRGADGDHPLGGPAPRRARRRAP